MKFRRISGLPTGSEQASGLYVLSAISASKNWEVLILCTAVMAEAGPVIEIEVNVKEDTAVAERPKVLNVSGKNRRGSSDARGGKPGS